jgi:hypothetical protein
VTTIVAQAPFAKLQIQAQVHHHHGRRGRKSICAGGAEPPAPEVFGRVPRVARLMALALRFEHLLRSGAVRNLAELARLGYVTRARVTQIMNLLCLAPNIQDDILFLPPIDRGRDPIHEWQLRPITRVLDWRKQRRLWRELRARVG